MRAGDVVAHGIDLALVRDAVGQVVAGVTDVIERLDRIEQQTAASHASFATTRSEDDRIALRERRDGALRVLRDRLSSAHACYQRAIAARSLRPTGTDGSR